MKPRYEHDCTTCRFLGHDGTHDVYAHVRRDGDVCLIRRHSSEGSDYGSFSFLPETWRSFLTAPHSAIRRSYEKAIQLAIEAGVIMDTSKCKLIPQEQDDGR